MKKTILYAHTHWLCKLLCIFFHRHIEKWTRTAANWSEKS